MDACLAPRTVLGMPHCFVHVYLIPAREPRLGRNLWRLDFLFTECWRLLFSLDFIVVFSLTVLMLIVLLRMVIVDLIILIKIT